MKHLYSIICAGLLGAASAGAADAPFYATEDLFNQSNTNTLDLSYAPGVETFTVFAPGDDTDKFSNGVAVTEFKGNLYCMWQSSAKDEDAEDTWVAYARSDDGGLTWSAPMVLAATLDEGYRSSGGWIATDDVLTGFLNCWPKGLSPKGGYTQYVQSTDGITWSAPADVTMKDGSRLDAIFEQDPHKVSGGRIVNAAHFQPGLKVYPIYTDEPTGTTGWVKADFTPTPNGDQSRELEPSLYQKPDGTLVMIFRDQNSTYYKMGAESTDNGETWSKAVKTNMPDARTKQSAGNLPDGTAFFAGNPVTNKTRIPLVITLSSDGTLFDRAYLLREGGPTMPALRYDGSAKRAGYHYPKSMVAGDYLYVAYALNKEDVQVTRVPLSGISYRSGIGEVNENGEGMRLEGRNLYVAAGQPVKVFTPAGQCVAAKAGADCIDLSALPAGIYIVKSGTAAMKVALR